MRPDDDLQKIKIAEKIVVADTSPLNYLVQVECDFLLPFLYRRVITPPIVLAELTHAGAPPAVARWAAEPPLWLEVSPLTTQPDEDLCLLDAGERDAIQLAIEVSAPEVLIDEFKGRREALARGFSIVGTLGVLIAAERARLVDARSAFERLTSETNFRITPELRHSFLESLRFSSGT
ncbi:DUF3368 domain-containing protein [Granulicella aggregans]|jgi:predicted nucleic acid-binding protein|uniref:DUF3368 domain-containing protein n=1 Tax=Granulicella aggregans TaxID=474949 RepID=UPI0021E067CB|nr:DUF3368 domain-containing protein [Granulicella aggregans]